MSQEQDLNAALHVLVSLIESTTGKKLVAAVVVYATESGSGAMIGWAENDIVVANCPDKLSIMELMLQNSLDSLTKTKVTLTTPPDVTN